MIQIGGLSTFSPLAALRIKSFFKGANSGIGIDLVLRRSEEDRCWFMEIAEKLLCIWKPKRVRITEKISAKNEREREQGEKSGT